MSVDEGGIREWVQGWRKLGGERREGKTLERGGGGEGGKERKVSLPPNEIRLKRRDVQ